jgi:hypothetical protein
MSGMSVRRNACPRGHNVLAFSCSRIK